MPLSPHYGFRSFPAVAGKVDRRGDGSRSVRARSPSRNRSSSSVSLVFKGTDPEDPHRLPRPPRVEVLPLKGSRHLRVKGGGVGLDGEVEGVLGVGNRARMFIVEPPIDPGCMEASPILGPVVLPVESVSGPDLLPVLLPRNGYLL